VPYDRPCRSANLKIAAAGTSGAGIPPRWPSQPPRSAPSCARCPVLPWPARPGSTGCRKWLARFLVHLICW